MAMARKNEFKPDKPRSGLLNKLYLTQKQRRSLLKWGLYTLVLVLLSVLQDVILSRYTLFGANTDLVPCGIFLICILEGMESGSVFCLVASLVYLFSGTAAGPYCVVFITFLGVWAAFIRQSYLQKGFGAATLCTGACVLIYELLVFVFVLFLGLTTLNRVGVFLITGVVSALAAPLLYPAVHFIGTIGGETWKE